MNRAAPRSPLAASAPPEAAPRLPRLAALFVVSTLCLQVVAGFKLLAPPRRFEALAPLRLAPTPALWPFLDYDMYSNHWHEGRSIDRPRVVGIDAAGARHELDAEALGLPFRAFRDEWMNPLRGGDATCAARIAARWHERGGVSLESIVMENEPAIVTRDGIRAGAILRERTIPVAAAEDGR